LGGLENMSKLPGVVIIIGQPEEIHAVRECRQLGIPTITLLDSNCDPTLADWFIPANDDSVSALNLVLNSFEKSIIQGQKKFQENQSVKASKQLAKQLTRIKLTSTRLSRQK
jgi:small subunit ribosomal protein S2